MRSIGVTGVQKCDVLRGGRRGEREKGKEGEGNEHTAFFPSRRRHTSYWRDWSSDVCSSDLEATVDMDSIDTRQEQRDAHIRSADFFDVGNHTVMTFRSTEVRTDGADWTVVGDLTLKGITKPVELALEVIGFGPDAYGGTGARFSAKTEISRKEFGVDIDMPMDGGGVVVGDKISIELEIEAVLRTA